MSKSMGYGGIMLHLFWSLTYHLGTARHSRYHWCPVLVHGMREHMLSWPWGIQLSGKTLQFLWGFLSNLLSPYSSSCHGASPGTLPALTCHVNGGNISLFSSWLVTGIFSCEGWLQSVLASCEMVVLTGCIPPTGTCSCILFSIT